VALALAGVVAGIAWVLWATSDLATVVSGHPTDVGLAGLAHLGESLPSHLADPAAAYAGELGHEMPPAPVWWLLAGVVLLASTVPLFALSALWNRHRPPSPDARWASSWDLRALRVRGPAPGRLVLGKVGRRLAATEACHSVMVFGPTGSMKTTGLVIPSILEWDGPVLSTTIKSDVIEATYAARRSEGARTWVFDPTLASAYPRSGWSPLDGCDNWERAKLTGQALASAAQTVSGTDLRDDSFWYGGAGRTISLYLFAAAVTGQSIDQVVRWVSTQEHDEVAMILDRACDLYALEAWAALWSGRYQLRQDFFSTAVAALDAFSSPAVRQTLRLSEIDFEAFLDGGRHTIYVSAPHTDQAKLRPLFSAFMAAAIDTIYATASARPLPKPVLVVIDEAANIAPLEDLPSIAATARSHGIQLVTVWQDLAQVEERYRSSSRTLFNNHLAKIVLSGCSDLTTLSYLSQLLGQSVVHERSTHHDAVGVTSSTTEAPRHHALAPVDSIRQMRRGHGLLVYGHLRPARLRLRLSWADRRLRRLAQPATPPEPVGSGLGSRDKDGVPTELTHEASRPEVSGLSAMRPGADAMRPSPRTTDPVRRGAVARLGPDQDSGNTPRPRTKPADDLSGRRSSTTPSRSEEATALLERARRDRARARRAPAQPNEGREL
jgi:type IV secretion system protein VirD4